MLWLLLAVPLLSAVAVGGAVVWWKHLLRPERVSLRKATLAGLLSVLALLVLGFGGGEGLFLALAAFSTPAFFILGMWAGNVRRLEHRLVRLYVSTAITSSGLCWALVFTAWAVLALQY